MKTQIMLGRKALDQPTNDCEPASIARERSACCHRSRTGKAVTSRLPLTTARVKGAEPASLLKEASSYDTIGNGFFAMTIHAVPAGWRCGSNCGPTQGSMHGSHHRWTSPPARVHRLMLLECPDVERASQCRAHHAACGHWPLSARDTNPRSQEKHEYGLLL